MNSINGKVLHSQTGLGIQNLIVTIYDLDPIPYTSSGEQNKGSLGELYRFLFNNQLQLRSGLEAYLQIIYYNLQGFSGAEQEEDPVLKTPREIAGDRLGSVLTDEKGEFTLQYEDAAFQRNDQEVRPDLVLFVLAPEYSVEITLPNPNEGGEAEQQPRTQFVPVPEHLRVLHFTLFPRRNAGRMESAAIKLTSEQLETHNVPTPSLGGSTVDFAELVKADAGRKTAVQASLKEVRQEKLNKHREREQYSETFIRNLSAVPKNFRESPFFVGQGTTAEEAKTTARQQGVSQIAAHTNFANANIRLSDRDLTTLGITNLEAFKSDLTQNGSVSETLNLEDICDLFQQKNGGVELTRRVTELLEILRDPENPCGENDRQQECENGNRGGKSGESRTPLDVEEQIKQIVLERVKAMQIADPEKDCREDQITQIRNTINNLVPPVSPADVTAFYDFQHLQIAFPDVWAEAFDGNVSELVRKIDIEYREYTDELEVERDRRERNPADLQDLNDYTRLMGKLIGDIASLDDEPPMPNVVRDLLERVFSSSGSDIRNRLGTATVNGKGKVVVSARKPSSGSASRPGTATVNGEGKVVVSARKPSSGLAHMWRGLSITQKEELIRIATDQIKREVTVPASNPGGSFENTIKSLLGKDIPELVNAGVNLLREVKQPGETQLQPISDEEKQQLALEIISNPEGRVTRVQNLLQEMAERLQEPHSFRIFQKNTVNYGIVTTYRQEWQPGNYQVGSMVSSLPLTPGETRKYTKKEMLKKSRSEKENERYASTIQDERNLTSRATSDIVQKANTATNFEQSIQTRANGSIGVFSLGANTNTSFSRNQAVESQKTKNAFREAVRKASQEYKNERSLEISTEEISEFESTFTSEISNPNNEITVTYLFYELERQYRITERLHKLTPVVLVAQEIPNPAEIDEDWLLAYEWILRRVLLDDSFNDALDYVAEGLVGDEVALEVMREHYETQKALVEDLGTTVETLTSLQDSLRDTLIQTSEQEKLARVARKRSKKRRRRSIGRGIVGIPPISPRLASGSASLAFGNRSEDPAVLEGRREALETRLEFLEGTLEDTRSQFTSANSALSEATAEFTQAVQESFTKRNLVNQLRIHVKDNILYYMQMIWSYEHPDQRYFRLYDIPVEIPIPAQPREPSPTPPVSDPSSPGSAPPPSRPISADVTFAPQLGDRLAGIYGPLLRMAGLAAGEIIARLRLPAPTINSEKKTLHEIADLDNLMGFKGNYMIFPLKQCTYITDFMMQDYVDDYFGLRDPDSVGEFSTEELLCYAEALYHFGRFSDDEEKQALKEQALDAINRLVQERLTSPRIENELIVVPTGQLFIEALKGEHALLENFKLLHRQLDVQKVEEEVRMAQLENLRHAMRLTQDAPLLDDSNIDKKIMVEGNGAEVIVPTE